MSQGQLSTGVCAWLYGAPPDEINELTAGSVFTFQVLSIMLAATDRYRIILSDGIHFIQAMLMPHLNESLVPGEITQHTIVNITRLQCNILNNTRLVMIHNLKVVSKQRAKMGNPRPAPILETSESVKATPSHSDRKNDSMEISPEVSTSARVKLKPTMIEPAPNQKPGRATIPIEGINRFRGAFTIKALVTHKTDIRTWSKPSGEGRLFSVTFTDETGDISATAFTEVVDEFYDKFEENKVYYVSKLRVGPAKYSGGSHPYELYFERNTDAEECLDITSLPRIKYNFVRLSSLRDIELNGSCDVIGVVTESGSLEKIVSKATNRTVLRRDLTLVDNSLYSVRLTIWGKEAETFNGDDVPVVAFKGIKVSEFGGRSLSAVSNTFMSISPDIPEAHFLRGWYDNIGTNASYQSYSYSSSSSSSGSSTSFTSSDRNNMRHVRDIVEAQSQLDESDKLEFSVCATVMHILDDKLVYAACPWCHKRVNQAIDSSDWQCTKCQKTVPRPDYRYRITMAVGDWSGQTWLTGFDQIGQAVLENTAEELEDLKERSPGEYKALLSQACRKQYNIRCMIKQDTYNDRKSVKYDITKISPLDYHEEVKHLRDLLMQPQMKLK